MGVSVRTIPLRQWKQLLEGMRRTEFILEWRNGLEGHNAIREYLFEGEVIARMCVIDSETDKTGQDCERVFEAREDLIDATAHIYIPTDSEYEVWAEEENQTNADVTSCRIAEREGRVYVPPARKRPA